MLRGTIFGVGSAVGLVVVMAMALYALRTAVSYSLPISNVLGGFTLLLPIVGTTIQLSLRPSQRGKTAARRNGGNGSQKRSSIPRSFVLYALMTIYSTVVATLSLGHAVPASGLRCGLEEQWQRLYHGKNIQAIKRIQDAFGCCGLRSPVDRAFPFPDKTHDSKACSRQYERTRGCYGDWLAKEQEVGWIQLVVAVLVFVWMTTMLFGSYRSSSLSSFAWLDDNENPRAQPARITEHEEDEDEGANGTERSALEYPRAGERYTDEPLSERSEQGVETPAAEAAVLSPQNEWRSSGDA